MSLKFMKKKWLTNAAGDELIDDVKQSPPVLQSVVCNGSAGLDTSASNDSVGCTAETPIVAPAIVKRPSFKDISANIYGDGDQSGTRCPAGEFCTNKRFQKLQYAPVEVRSAGKKGNGLFAVDDIQAGDFLIEYVGEVLNASRFAKRSRKYDRDKEHRHHYFMALGKGEVIDATEQGNISRFINHSCDPNAETQKWTVSRQLRIGFFAKKAIMKDEELTFDYQFERFGQEAQECYCGASNCRKVIGDVSTRAATSVEFTEDDAVGDGLTSEQTESTSVVAKSATADRVQALERARNRRDIVEDFELVSQREKLVSIGSLKNKDQVIHFCRLMVRGDDFENRMKLLDVLLATVQPVLSIFATAGLKLIWIWMLDEENSDAVQMTKLRLKLLDVLQHLTDTAGVFTSRNQLEDSGLLRLIEKWSVRPPQQHHTATAAPTAHTRRPGTRHLLATSTPIFSSSNNSSTVLLDDDTGGDSASNDEMAIRRLMDDLVTAVVTGVDAAAGGGGDDTPSASSDDGVDTPLSSDSPGVTPATDDDASVLQQQMAELREMDADIRNMSDALLVAWKPLQHKTNFKIPKLAESDRSSQSHRRRFGGLTKMEPKSILADRDRPTKAYLYRTWSDGAAKKTGLNVRDSVGATADRKRKSTVADPSPDRKRTRPSRFDEPPSSSSETSLMAPRSSTSYPSSGHSGNDESTPDLDYLDKSDYRKMCTQNFESNESAMLENEFEMALAEASVELENEQGGGGSSAKKPPSVIKKRPQTPAAVVASAAGSATTPAAFGPSPQAEKQMFPLLVAPGQPNLGPEFDDRSVKPGLLVQDPSHNMMWQDRSSRKVVCTASPEDVARVLNGDLSQVPWFFYNLAEDTVHQVDANYDPRQQIAAAVDVQVQQQQYEWDAYAALYGQQQMYGGAAAGVPPMWPAAAFYYGGADGGVSAPRLTKKQQIAMLQRQIDLLNQLPDDEEDDPSVLFNPPPPPPAAGGGLVTAAPTILVSSSPHANDMQVCDMEMSDNDDDGDTGGRLAKQTPSTTTTDVSKKTVMTTPATSVTTGQRTKKKRSRTPTTTSTPSSCIKKERSPSAATPSSTSTVTTPAKGRSVKKEENVRPSVWKKTFAPIAKKKRPATTPPPLTAAEQTSASSVFDASVDAEAECSGGRVSASLDERLEAMVASSTTSSPPPVVPPPAPTLKPLPAGWATNLDDQGNCYYYNLVTRVSQWTPPPPEKPGDEQPVDSTSCIGDDDDQPSTSSAKKATFKSPTTTAAADTSSDVAKRARERFKADISKVVIKAMEPFKKSHAFVSGEQFKKFARKLSHGILEKEEKRGVRADELRVTKAVAKKAREFVISYCEEKLNTTKPASVVTPAP